MNIPHERVALALTRLAADTHDVFGAHLNRPFAVISTILPPGEQREAAKQTLVFALEDIRKALVADIVARGKDLLGYEVPTETDDDDEDKPKETPANGFYG